jgi:hypothetical protein
VVEDLLHDVLGDIVVDQDGAEVPYAGDIHALPPDLKARLFDVFDLGILWNRSAGQATVTAVITDATLQALPAILDPDQDGYHDTASPQPLPS